MQWVFCGDMIEESKDGEMITIEDFVAEMRAHVNNAEERILSVFEVQRMTTEVLISEVIGELARTRELTGGPGKEGRCTSKRGFILHNERKVVFELVFKVVERCYRRTKYPQPSPTAISRPDIDDCVQAINEFISTSCIDYIYTTVTR